MMEQALDQFMVRQDRAYADPCQGCPDAHRCDPEHCVDFLEHVRASKDYGDPCEGCPSFEPGCQPNCAAQ